MPEPGVAAAAERLIGERTHLLVRIGVFGLVVALIIQSAVLAWFITEYFATQDKLNKVNASAANQRGQLENQLNSLSQTTAILSSQVDAFRQQLIANGIKPVDVPAPPAAVTVITPTTQPGNSSSSNTTAPRSTFTTTAPTTTTTAGSRSTSSTTTTVKPSCSTLPLVGSCVPGTSQGKAKRVT